jgi:4-amino-4-deoxy-L-arabinose transferase-like glycosyltransferase
VRKPLRQWEWLAIGLVTFGALLLRVVFIERVSPDPFYDAAVRSMSLSWHNFFFGAFEPGGSVSIDKPPVDLWLQVASVKLLGFSSTTLKVPEILAGVLSVPLLFWTVRRVWGPLAGLTAGVALAVLPVEVITARSDTMDGVMMILLVLALALLVRAAETGSRGWLLGAAAALGLAFDVKLLESLIALPGLALFAWLALPGPARRRAMQLLAAGAVYLVVALSWLTATLLFPAHERPFAIGSSNGSAWNAAFVFNGTQRLGGKSAEPQFTVYQAGHHYPERTQSQRDHIPIVPPSPTRLLARIGPLSGERLGLMLLVALLLGVPAVGSELLARRRGGGPGAHANGRGGVLPPEPAPAPVAAGVAGRSAPWPAAAAAGAPGVDPAATGGGAAIAAADDPAQRRLRLAFGAGLVLWTLTGIVLFSYMSRLHPRYVEAISPAVAALFGIGVAWAATPASRARLALLVGTLLIVIGYGERLMYGVPPTFWIVCVSGLAAIGCAVFAVEGQISARTRGWLAPPAVLALMLVSVLAIPLGADLTAMRDGVTDAGYVGALPPRLQRHISAYLRENQRGAYYEVAAQSATAIGSLIVQDARPVLVLTTYGTRVFTPVPKLRLLIAEGKVRYAFLGSACTHPTGVPNASCTAPVRWVRAHGTDVSSQAGLAEEGALWLLPGAKP